MRKSWLLSLGFWLLAGLGNAATDQEQTQPRQEASGQVRTEIPYRDGTVILLSDSQEKFSKTAYRVTGNVRIAYQDMVITCDAAEYDEASQRGSTTGLTRFTQGQQWLTSSRAEFEFGKQTATFYNATGFTDQEFLLKGQTVHKTGPDTFFVERGSLTACPEKTPKWAFGVGGARIRVDQTARLRRVVFRIKGVPVFYFPFMIVPMENKRRSSGFLPFHYGNSSSKGRQFHLAWFQTLGRSADITFYGDYYSLRGMGYGGIFRSRPNQSTNINIQGYGVPDKLDQGGAQLVVEAESRFDNGFRTVADVNITTNFQFRQAFSEGFRSATTSEERSVLFATINPGAFAGNFALERLEVIFPIRPLVIRKSPSLELVSLGRPLGRLPLIFYLRAAAEGLARVDSVIETPRIVQRLDFYPRVALRLPALAGFALMPSIGLRETYYSAHLSEDARPVVVPTPLHRQYLDLELNLRTPVVERTFHSRQWGDFRHLIEPLITYRWIRGITELRQIIRFDEEDAIADTDEVEYGIVNRVLRRRAARPGFVDDYEFLSFKVAQKYYFDPTFGGAFLPGESNLFYPLNTLTGFSATRIQRSLAPVSMSLRLTPRPGISYDALIDYDTRLYRLRDSSLTAVWQQGSLFVAGTYFKTNALEPGTFEANHIQGQFGFGDPSLNRGFSASFALSYNLRSGTMLNSNSRLHYAWNCCGVSIQFQQFDLGLRTESRFTFSFSLKGIGNFGNLKRPESLF